MSLTLVALVLLGALLHASWNALIKAGGDKALDTALVDGASVLIAIPVLWWTGFPARDSWPYLAASIATHLAYYITLAGAYEHGELSLTYPIMRGLAPMLVALASGPLIGEVLSLPAWLGVGAVCAGVVALGLLPSAVHAHAAGKALRYAVANAAIIAVYTVVDGLGVRESGNALAYVMALFFFNSVPYGLYVFWRRVGRRREALQYMAGRWKSGLVASIASLGSYGIALWAMTRAPVALVAALRETSVLFAALIGVVWLREPFGVLRAVGMSLIVAGVVALRFG